VPKLWEARNAVEREIGGAPPRPYLGDLGKEVGRLAASVVAQRLTGHPHDVIIPPKMPPADVAEALLLADHFLSDEPPPGRA
jgi:hypothetical protein